MEYNVFTATGYERLLAKIKPVCEVISEVKAFGPGVRFFSDSCRSIFDTGRHTAKAISLDESGNLIQPLAG